MIKNEKLKHVELYSENTNGFDAHFLKVVYQYEEENHLYELVIPKIYLPIDTNKLPSILSGSEYLVCSIVSNYHACDLGFGKCRLDHDKEGRLYYTNLIKTYPRKMTIEEIEKELGYKIDIVDKKED